MQYTTYSIPYSIYHTLYYSIIPYTTTMYSATSKKEVIEVRFFKNVVRMLR